MNRSTNQPPSLSKKKAALFALAVTLFAYALLEGCASLYAWLNWQGTSIALFEDADRTWQFDPVRGYRLNSHPSRIARITNGVPEYVTTVRGNSQGFADWDDFGPKRDPGYEKRYAVFGDSMSAGQCVGQNWPDRAEDLTRNAARPIQFLNFSVWAGGLPNWWSVLTRLVEAEGYELDGVIFAVYMNDLYRPFITLDERGYTRFMLGTNPSRDPKTYPTTLEEARPHFQELENSYNVSSEEFEGALQGKWPPSVPRPRLRPFLLTRAWNLCQVVQGTAPGQRIPDYSQPKYEPAVRNWLYEDIGRTLKARRLPAVVFYLPDRTHLLKLGPVPTAPLADTKAFAAAIGATFVDGNEMFAAMTPAEIRAHFHPYDAHMNQAGSNRAAEFVIKHLAAFDRPNGAQNTLTHGEIAPGGVSPP